MSRDSSAVVEKLLAEFARTNGPLTPPVPVEEIARWLGYQVILLQTVDDECSAIVSTRDRLIGVNARHHHRRQRFSIGHELGHILLEHPPERKCTLREIALFNREADACASAILMPGFLLLPAIRKRSSTNRLARLFDVSEEAMKRRLATVREFP